MTSPIRICDICKAPMEEELTDYYLDFAGEKLLIEDVPTWVCSQCDHSFVEDEVIEAVEDLIAHLAEVAEDED